MKRPVLSRNYDDHRPYSKVQSVCQIELEFRADNADALFATVRREMLTWLARRAGRHLPKHAWDGESFEMLEVGAQPVSALALENPRYWCFRFSDSDKQVPRRNWVTEAGIYINQTNVLFGCRLQCVSLGDSPPFDAAMPGLVVQAASNGGAFIDDMPVSTQAWQIGTDKDVATLVDLILDQKRLRPVIAISLGGEYGRDGIAAIDPNWLAKATIGAAHVVTLTENASYELTDRIGKKLSVFNRAVRTYRPSRDFEFDDPADHPIALPDSIEKWPNGGAEAFKRFLVSGELRSTVVGRDIYRSLPSFADIHAQVLKQRRSKAARQGASDKELLELALEENDSLSSKLKEERETFEGLLQTADSERRQLEGERDAARNETFNLQSRVIHLEAALKDSGKQEDVDIPQSFESLEEWCAKHLAGSIYILSRALRTAAKSEFDDPPLAYQALLMLRDYFVPMKRIGGKDFRDAYEARLKHLGLEDQPCFAGGRAGEQGDEYRVIYNGRPRYLDRHLKGSNSREERYGFRLYFFWDDESQQVVVGSFPAHLTTRAS